MNIFFGDNLAEEMAKIRTVLPLDTIHYSSTGITARAYATVDNVPLTQIQDIPSMTTLHNELLDAYNNQDWDRCDQAIKTLTGFWGGELDSFYSILQERITDLKHHTPADWSPIITK